MAFPAAGLAVPTLANFGWSYQGLTLNGSSPYGIKETSGVRGMPALRTGDSGRPRDHGNFIGLDLLPEREITLTLDVGPPFGTAATLHQALINLATALVPAGVTEAPLYFAEGGVTYACMARPRRNNIDQKIAYSAGNLAEDVAIQFGASDPRWYSTPTTTSACALPQPGIGFGFPLSFPWAFGTGTRGNTIVVTNAGNMDCRPIFTVTGPVTYPAITLSSGSGAPYVKFGVTVASGDQLIIDTDLHTALYLPSGAAVGYSVLSTWQPGSTWFSLAPGANTVMFTSNNTLVGAAGTLSMAWASAYLL